MLRVPNSFGTNQEGEQFNNIDLRSATCSECIELVWRSLHEVGKKKEGEKFDNIEWVRLFRMQLGRTTTEKSSTTLT